MKKFAVIVTIICVLLVACSSPENSPDVPSVPGAESSGVPAGQAYNAMIGDNPDMAWAKDPDGSISLYTDTVNEAGEEVVKFYSANEPSTIYIYVHIPADPLWLWGEVYAYLGNQWQVLVPDYYGNLQRAYQEQLDINEQGNWVKLQESEGVAETLFQLSMPAVLDNLEAGELSKKWLTTKRYGMFSIDENTGHYVFDVNDMRSMARFALPVSLADITYTDENGDQMVASEIALAIHARPPLLTGDEWFYHYIKVDASEAGQNYCENSGFTWKQEDFYCKVTDYLDTQSECEAKSFTWAQSTYDDCDVSSVDEPTCTSRVGTWIDNKCYYPNIDQTLCESYGLTWGPQVYAYCQTPSDQVVCQNAGYEWVQYTYCCGNDEGEDSCTDTLPNPILSSQQECEQELTNTWVNNRCCLGEFGGREINGICTYSPPPPSAVGQGSGSTTPVVDTPPELSTDPVIENPVLVEIPG